MKSRNRILDRKLAQATKTISEESIRRAIEIYGVIFGNCGKTCDRDAVLAAGCRYLYEDNLLLLQETVYGKPLIVLTDQLFRKLASARNILKAERKSVDIC